MSRREEDVELDLWVYNISPAAMLVGESLAEPDDEREKYWLPRSQILEASDPRSDGSRTFRVREWWAHKYRLI